MAVMVVGAVVVMVVGVGIVLVPVLVTASDSGS